MQNSGEALLICPYNKAHSILSSRMQFHLTRCRVQYPHSDKAVCPFNSTHIYNEIEMATHQQVCPDRITLDVFTCKIGKSSVATPPLPKIDPVDINEEESWDYDAPVSVLDEVHEVSKTKPTLTTIIGASRSVRKEFRNQERRRFQDFDSPSMKNKLKTDDESQIKKHGGERKMEGEGNMEGEKCRYDSVNGNQSLATTDVEQSYIAQKHSTPAISSSRNPWVLNKLDKDNPKQTKSDIDCMGLQDTCTKFRSNLNITSGRGRDISNPWGSAKIKHSANFNISSSDSDFPLLPVAGRGRGKQF